MEENKKLNILMATMQMGFGGAETHIYELCRALVRDGHTVTVASAGGRYADMLEATGIRHVTLPLHTKNPLAVLRCRAALKKLIASEQFDVVHAHARIPAFICGSLQKQLHFRFVTTAHWVFRVTPLWKRLANWGDRQMAVSEDIKQYLIDNYGQFADNISVTVNGIDTDSFAPGGDFAAIRDELALSPSAHRIVSVSRMDESRGKAQLCLAKCAGRLLEKYPDLEIVIVGDGVLSAERNLLADVREIADTLEKKHGRKIIFTPGLRTDTPAFLASADVFVGASRAALEAMSCGLPTVIAGNEGYIGIMDESRRDLALKTNYCCRDCGETTEAKLFADLCKLLDTAPEARRAMGDYCRRVILEDFSAARMARDYEAMYASLPAVTPDVPGKILVSGYYGFGNAGDDSIAAALVAGIRAYAPDLPITFFCKDPKNSAKKYGVRAVRRFNIPAVLREMRTAKLLISGGGNLLQNTTSSRSLFYYTTIIRMAKRRGLQVFVLANGLGPILGERYERDVARTLALADRITLREPQSLDYAASLGIPHDRMTLSADPALLLTPADARRVDYILKNVENVPHFAVSLRSFATLRSEEVGGADEDRFAATFAAEVDAIAARTGAKPLYILMQSSRDRDLTEKVNAAATVKGEILGGLTAREIMGVLERCEFVISMRLHLLIYAVAIGKPPLGISYDPKIDAMMRYMGCAAPLRVAGLKGGALADAAAALSGAPLSADAIERLKSLALADAASAVQMARGK